MTLDSDQTDITRDERKSDDKMEAEKEEKLDNSIGSCKVKTASLKDIFSRVEEAVNHTDKFVRDTERKTNLFTHMKEDTVDDVSDFQIATMFAQNAARSTSDRLEGKQSYKNLW